jgi:hopanoid biosynthesis associated protein HpnK
VIFSADDFGMSPAVNRGIVAAHRDGVLTNASVMVNGAAYADAVAQARAHPRLGVGLHLVLLQGRATVPPADAPALVEAPGVFSNNPVGAGLRYFFTPRLRGQLEREIRAQLEKFLSAGLALSHVDGHLNIHMHPTVLDILLRVAPQYRIRAIRLPREPLRISLRLDNRERFRKLVESVTFTALTAWARRRLAVHGIRHPDQLFGLHQSGHVTEAYLLGVLQRLPPGVTEIYCHAAMLDAEARRWRPAGYESEAELAALTSPNVRAAIAAAGIIPISYEELTPPA